MSASQVDLTVASFNGSFPQLIFIDSAPHPTFLLLMKLPFEIQYLIWEHAFAAEDYYGHRGQIGKFIGGRPLEHESMLQSSRFARQTALQWWSENIRDIPWPPKSLFYHEVKEDVVSAFDEHIEDLRARLDMDPRPKPTLEGQQDDTVEIMMEVLEEVGRQKIRVRKYERQEETKGAFLLDSDLDSDHDTEDEDDETDQEWIDEGEGMGEFMESA